MDTQLNTVVFKYNMFIHQHTNERADGFVHMCWHLWGHTFIAWGL